MSAAATHTAAPAATEPADAGLDLDSLQEQTQARVHLVHPVTGAALPASIVIAGPEHPARREHIFARVRRRRAQLERTQTLQVPDPEDDDAAELDLLAACTLGWQGMRRAGQPLAFSTAAARALYADPQFRWVRDQVRDALDRRALFFVSSATA